MSFYSLPLPKATNSTVIEFEQAQFHAQIKRVISSITGRSNKLLDVETILHRKNVCRSHYAGTHTVCIDQIHGSENSAHDFDRNFNPLKNNDSGRAVNQEAEFSKSCNKSYPHPKFSR